MISMSIEEINKEISLLEPAEINSRNVQILSSLYVIRNNIGQVPNMQRMPILTGTELNEALSKTKISDMLELLNEHMEVVKVLIPKEYASFMEKLSKL